MYGELHASMVILADEFEAIVQFAQAVLQPESVQSHMLRYRADMSSMASIRRVLGGTPKMGDGQA